MLISTRCSLKWKHYMYFKKKNIKFSIMNIAKAKACVL